MRALIGIVFVASLWLVSAGPARADTSSDPAGAPSVFTYGYRGLFVGALGGLAGGYLSARRGDFHRDDWRPLVLGAGFGGLSGAVIGLTLGIVDLARDRPGTTSVVLRDMLYGGGFGAVLGLLTGCLVIVRTHDGEHALFGTAIGTLSGLGLGLGLGIFEATRANRPAPQSLRYRPSLAMVRDAGGNFALAPAFSGSF
jgi:hypothetical protein